MYYIGVDLGGTNIAVGIMDESYSLIAKDKVPTKAKRHADEIVRDMATLAASLVERTGLDFSEIGGMGVAAPGAVDNASGTVKCCNNINMDQYPIVEKLKELLPITHFALANDADTAALAEAKLGAGKGCNNLVMVTLGTGVGGGIVVDGKLVTGSNGFGGEIGHMVISHGGRACSCGRRGCFEAYSSATALKQITKEHMRRAHGSLMWSLCDGDIDSVSARTPFMAAKQGDRTGGEVVSTYMEYLACGITNLINIFQPEVLCIGGGVCGEGEYLLAPLRGIIDREQYGTHVNDRKTELRIAQLGNGAGIIGAALICL